MNILTIDKNEYQKGITLDNDDEAGGMSPDGNGLNYFLSEGFTLIPQPSFTETTSDPTDDLVDGCVDPTYLGDDAFFITEDKKFYILDGTTLTLKQTDTTRNYIYGSTRIVTFKGDIYCTSNTDIAKLPPNMSSLDGTWWTSTQSKTALLSTWRHPMAVVEDTLYIADGCKIHTWDGTTSVYEAMSIPTSFNITELIKSSDGRSLIAFASETANYSHGKKTIAKAFIIDTVTLEFTREIKVADQTESALNVRGIIYVVYGSSFGYLTDNGFSFLRKLNISQPVYRARLTEMDNTILIAEDNRVLVYGDVNGKGNIFFYLAKTESPYNNIKHILALGSTGVDGNKLMLSYQIGSDKKIKFLDLEARGSYNIDALTKKYRKGKVWIRRVEVETETLASGDSLTLSTVNEDGTYNEIGTFSYALNGAVQKGRFDCNHLVDFIQLRLQWANFGIKKITIYYESGE